MELNEFIRTTLNEILMGVQKAQTDWEKNNHSTNGIGAAINPSVIVQGAVKNQGMKEVDFDIGVTINESTKGVAGGKIGISVVGINGEMQQENSQSKVSRIRFQVPIRFSGFHI